MYAYHLNAILQFQLNSVTISNLVHVYFCRRHFQVEKNKVHNKHNEMFNTISVLARRKGIPAYTYRLFWWVFSGEIHFLFLYFCIVHIYYNEYMTLYMFQTFKTLHVTQSNF